MKSKGQKNIYNFVKGSITAERRSVTYFVWRVRGRADSNESCLSRIAIDALGSDHEEADSRMFSHTAYALRIQWKHIGTRKNYCLEH